MTVTAPPEALTDPAAPFGRFKASGVGRARRAGLEAYLETKTSGRACPRTSAELARERPHPIRDLVTDHAHLLHRQALRVRQVPVQVSPPRDVGAFVPASHRDDHDRPFRALGR